MVSFLGDQSFANMYFHQKENLDAVLYILDFIITKQLITPDVGPFIGQLHNTTQFKTECQKKQMIVNK